MSIIKINGSGAGKSLRINGAATGAIYVNGTASKLIGSSGGTIQMAGLPGPGTILIPAGALASDVTITAVPVDSTNVSIADTTYVGAAIQLGPEGQTFSQPVTITIPVGNLPEGVSISDLVIYTAPVGSSNYTALATTVAGPGLISATVDHFSSFVVAVPAPVGPTGSGTASDPYVMPADGNTYTYNYSFTNDNIIPMFNGHGLYFRFNVPNDLPAGQMVVLYAEGDFSPPGPYYGVNKSMEVYPAAAPANAQAWADHFSDGVISGGVKRELQLCAVNFMAGGSTMMPQPQGFTPSQAQAVGMIRGRSNWGIGSRTSEGDWTVAFCNTYTNEGFTSGTIKVMCQIVNFN